MCFFDCRQTRIWVCLTSHDMSGPQFTSRLWGGCQGDTRAELMASREEQSDDLEWDHFGDIGYDVAGVYTDGASSNVSWHLSTQLSDDMVNNVSKSSTSSTLSGSNSSFFTAISTQPEDYHSVHTDLDRVDGRPKKLSFTVRVRKVPQSETGADAPNSCLTKEKLEYIPTLSKSGILHNWFSSVSIPFTDGVDKSDREMRSPSFQVRIRQLRNMLSSNKERHGMCQNTKKLCECLSMESYSSPSKMSHHIRLPGDTAFHHSNNRREQPSVGPSSLVECSPTGETVTSHSHPSGGGKSGHVNEGCVDKRHLSSSVVPPLFGSGKPEIHRDGDSRNEDSSKNSGSGQHSKIAHHSGNGQLTDNGHHSQISQHSDNGHHSNISHHSDNGHHSNIPHHSNNVQHSNNGHHRNNSHHSDFSHHSDNSHHSNIHYHCDNTGNNVSARSCNESSSVENELAQWRRSIPHAEPDYDAMNIGLGFAENVPSDGIVRSSARSYVENIIANTAMVQFQTPCQVDNLFGEMPIHETEYCSIDDVTFVHPSSSPCLGVASVPNETEYIDNRREQPSVGPSSLVECSPTGETVTSHSHPSEGGKSGHVNEGCVNKRHLSSSVVPPLFGTGKPEIHRDGDSRNEDSSKNSGSGQHSKIAHHSGNGQLTDNGHHSQISQHSDNGHHSNISHHSDNGHHSNIPHHSNNVQHSNNGHHSNNSHHSDFSHHSDNSHHSNIHYHCDNTGNNVSAPSCNESSSVENELAQWRRSIPHAEPDYDAMNIGLGFAENVPSDGIVRSSARSYVENIIANTAMVQFQTPCQVDNLFGEMPIHETEYCSIDDVTFVHPSSSPYLGVASVPNETEYCSTNDVTFVNPSSSPCLGVASAPNKTEYCSINDVTFVNPSFSPCLGVASAPNETEYCSINDVTFVNPSFSPYLGVAPERNGTEYCSINDVTFVNPSSSPYLGVAPERNETEYCSIDDVTFVNPSPSPCLGTASALNGDVTGYRSDLHTPEIITSPVSTVFRYQGAPGAKHYAWSE
ncbi:hypothetical protein ScPMuIL_015440 [Solemya velum]